MTLDPFFWGLWGFPQPSFDYVEKGVQYMTARQQALLKQNEQRIRQRLEVIIHAKEAGVKQRTLDKMIVQVSYEKKELDLLKARFEADGK